MENILARTSRHNTSKHINEYDVIYESSNAFIKRNNEWKAIAFAYIGGYGQTVEATRKRYSANRRGLLQKQLFAECSSQHQ